MKNTLTIVLAAAVLLPLCGCRKLFEQAEKADEVARAVLSAIAAGDVDSICEQHVSSSVGGEAFRGKFDTLAESMRTQLGDFKSLSRKTFFIRSKIGGARTTGDFEYNVKWAKGSGTVKMHMVKEDGRWKLVSMTWGF